MHFRSPFELEKQCQASFQVDIGMGGFVSRCHRVVSPPIVFWDDPWGDCRVSAGESGVSGVDWDIRVFWNGGTTPGVPLSVKLRPPTLRCNRNTGIPFRTKQENGPSSQDEEGKLGLFLSCFRTLSVPLECQVETAST